MLGVGQGVVGGGWDMWVEKMDFSLPFDFRGKGETFAWMHMVLYYPVEAFEVRIMSSVFGGTQSIAYSLFKMWSLRLLSWKLKSSAPLALFKNTWAYVSFLEQEFHLFRLFEHDRCYTRIVWSSGWCSCKAHAHTCVEEDFTTTSYRKKCLSLVLCWKCGGISADKISV